MNILKDFIYWKRMIEELKPESWQELYSRVENKNPWFTPENQRSAVDGILQFLDDEKLQYWLSRYKIPENGIQNEPATVGLVLAGNLPLVGFHDLICVLASGHNAKVKLSSKDDVLPKFLIELLYELNPSYQERIQIAELLKGSDAMIATGSDNSSRYFEYYFREIPHIIRKNRTSVAVITGDETEEDLKSLGTDIFQYFGMGCRNVSKIFLPKGYEPSKILDHLDDHKSIYLVNKNEFLDNGFLLLHKSEKLVSPISVVFYQEYSNPTELIKLIDENRSKIQCIVTHSEVFEERIPFGRTQKPELWDYADNVDTMDFLLSL